MPWPVKSGSCGSVATVVPGWAKRVPPSAIGSPARMRSRVDLPAPLRPTSDSRSPGAIDEIDAVQDGLVAEMEADAGEGQEGWSAMSRSGAACLAEAVHRGKDNYAAYIGAAMLQVVGDPKRIDRAIKRLHGALKGVPARGVRLTWRGGELRTTIHWVRDDAFWWAVEPRHQRDALVLGHAPDPPARRESITCEINLPRAGADRKVAGIIATDESGAFYLAHSGRAAANRASASSWATACGARCNGPTARRPRR